MPKNSSSLFDDIFRLQNAAPDEDLDPEDLEDGLKASLVESVDDAEILGASNLRKKAAIIPDDPRYKGKKTSRKNLYSDDEEDVASLQSSDGVDSEASDNQDVSEEGKDDDEESGSDDVADDDDDDDDDDNEDDMETDNRPEESMEQSESDDGDVNEDKETKETAEDADILTPKKSDDREKGKAVLFQLDVWDDLIKSRIAMQKLVSSCNCLPQPDIWTDFESNESFRKEARNVHSSVRKLLSALLDLQSHLSNPGKLNSQKSPKSEDSDEEITSESEFDEDEDGDNQKKSENVNGDVKLKSGAKSKTGGHDDGEADDDAEEGDDDDVDEDDEEENEDIGSDNENIEESGDASLSKAGDKAHKNHPHHFHQHRARMKRKLEVDEVEETLAKRQADFRSFRNDTLSKWDEKTRLVHGKVKSKNFAAFEVPVLKQIEQVLVNRDRLVRRIHQKRSEYNIVGKTENTDMAENNENDDIDDEDVDVELKLKQRSKNELSVDWEVIDDNDFYHVCLRDLIEMKQNEETDPITANKQWLEIQRLRNKQKKKVDTRASKGRKIRYNIKEKLKNFMTPYDKSSWSDEQKDDLFKALFGGRGSQQEESTVKEDQDFILGL